MGRATQIADPILREQAVRASPYVPQDSYVLFMFTVEFAFMNRYVDGKSNSRRWSANPA